VEAPAVVLVHGFSGARSDLDPLAERLAEVLGESSVLRVDLSGHSGEAPALEFDRDALVGEVVAVLRKLGADGRRAIVLGHSTGGNIALAALEQAGFEPDLLVLAATPFAIDLAYLDRWQRHRDGKDGISLFSVASMVSLVNATGAKGSAIPFPTLLVQGEDDDLVPPQEAEKWQGKIDAPVRRVIVPGSGHQLFIGAGSIRAIEAVAAEVANTDRQEAFAVRLTGVEPEAQKFLEGSPRSLPHLARCPSGRRVMGEVPELPTMVDWQPVFANIEITTRCNLGCRFCARSFASPAERDMPEEVFARVLESLPDAYRLTLVGLGETLLHPSVVDFVSRASGMGRRTALVTNAMQLTPELSVRLLEAGLDSIAFSIDAADPVLMDRLRQGTDLVRVTRNVRAFTALARGAARPVSTAVFSALSRDSVGGLSALIELVAALGVHVMMLSDLNFEVNQSESLAANVEAGIAEMVCKAVALAFSRNLPVLTVRGLEELGLAKRYPESLLFPPDQLYKRSERRGFCFSPWQTVAVDVEGNISLCDCQPERRIGNLLETPLQEIWNGPAMRDHRRCMLGNDPPAACRGCPRF